MRSLAFLLCGFVIAVSAQPITWTDISSSAALPAGVKLYSGSRTSPALSAWYLDVDMNNSAIAVRPYLTGSTANVATLTTRFGAIASVNGGVFGGSQSLSTIVYPLELKAQNVAAVTRNNVSYPVMRSFFGVNTDRTMQVDWVYHFDATLAGLRRFAAPIPYAYQDPTPQSAPSSATGTPYDKLLLGIGGVPTLVKAGAVRVTLNEEIVWGSGIAEDTSARDPRTAVGYSASRHVILLVADGRGVNGSDGLGLGELARVLIGLGCVEAMNLDGGGSTQMAVGGTTINGQSSRAVPTIFSVVYTDSLNLPKTPTFEKIIDTGDPGASLVGSGWFESANTGYYGSTQSKLNPAGDGSAYAVFKPDLPRAATYTVYGWWVASSNRSVQTPFIITHAGVRDTVRVNQTANGSQWVPIGTYAFTGGPTDSVMVSNLIVPPPASTYVVADAVRFVSFEPGFTGVEGAADVPGGIWLGQNYPNPFNPETKIGWRMKEKGWVKVSVVDLLGREVAVLVNEEQPGGVHTATWNAVGMPSGVYFCKLEIRNAKDQSSAWRETRKMVLMR